jgi:hypothetical protein
MAEVLQDRSDSGLIDRIKKYKNVGLVALGVAVSGLASYEFLGKRPGIEHGFSGDHYTRMLEHQSCASLVDNLTVSDHQQPVITLAQLSEQDKSSCELNYLAEDSVAGTRAEPVSMELPSVENLIKAAQTEGSNAETMETTDRILATATGVWGFITLGGAGVGINALRKASRRDRLKQKA